MNKKLANIIKSSNIPKSLLEKEIDKIDIYINKLQRTSKIDLSMPLKVFVTIRR